MLKIYSTLSSNLLVLEKPVFLGQNRYLINMYWIKLEKQEFFLIQFNDARRRKMWIENQKKVILQ